MKKHIFTTDSTPEPIKLRQRELFYSDLLSRVTSWGLYELLASLPIPGKAGIIHRPWIMPFTFRFHLLLFSASLGINQFLFPLTQRPLAELLAALSQSCCQPFHQEILGPQVTSVTSASLELSWPLQEPSAPEARQHPHLRNYWAQPALLRTDLGLKEGQRGLKSLIPETFHRTGNSVEEQKVLSSSPCLGSQFSMWNLKHLAWNRWNIGLITFPF